jgi:protein-L-isoaspartate(D-aspartate) O-methyltransferase
MKETIGVFRKKRETTDDITQRKNELIAYFKTIRVAKTPKVFEAFLQVPREEFVLPAQRKKSYDDHPLPLLEKQTISAPHMCVMLLESLWPGKPDFPCGEKILEIGTGSGYQAALLAEMVAPSTKKKEEWGHVFTMERFERLAEFARANLERTGYTERITIFDGDGTLGYPEEAPFDQILVTAASPNVPPPLIAQLKEGGHLVLPVGSKRFNQVLLRVEKRKNGKITQTELGGVAFVPLIGKHGWEK